MELTSLTAAEAHAEVSRWLRERIETIQKTADPAKVAFKIIEAHAQASDTRDAIDRELRRRTHR